MDIVVLALSRWDGEYSSSILSLAKVLAREHRVFYIDNPFTLKDLFLGIRSKQIRRRIGALLFKKKLTSRPIEHLPNFISISTYFTIPINWLPPGWLFSTLSRINERILSRPVRKVLEEYRVKNFIFLNSFNPFYWDIFSDPYRPRLTVYHSVDDISRSPYVSKHGPQLERMAIAKANLTLTSSSELMRLQSRWSDYVYLLPNAADVGLFQKAVISIQHHPAELTGIPNGQRIIMYMGNICHRLDYELIMKIARRLPDHKLLIVGPFANKFYKKVGLHREPNVIFTGPKKLEELPSYLQHVHCCIIPFLCNSLTRSIYPLKINEYLAAGKPVVTTGFSEDVLEFREVVCIARNHEEFISGITRAIETDSVELQEKRMAYAAVNNWELRGSEFWTIVENLRLSKYGKPVHG